MKIDHLTVVPRNFMKKSMSKKERIAQRLLTDPDPRVRSRIQDYRLGEQEGRALQKLTLMAFAGSDPGCSFREMKREIKARLDREK